jgi:prephenate dehydrogenase
MKHKKQQVTIIGFGRFGQTWYRLISKDFKVVIFIKHPEDHQPIKTGRQTTITASLPEAYESDTVFYAVPISAFASVIAGHKEYFRPDQLLIDLLSVKTHPAQVLMRHLRGSQTQALLTHPMFGPDSSKDGFEGLRIVMDQFLASRKNYNFWKDYFIETGLRVIEMPAQEHDKLAARSQALVHFVGRLLEQIDLEPTPIDTLGSIKLQEVQDQTIHDTWQLFLDIQQYNPYAKGMLRQFDQAYRTLRKNMRRVK